jgi:hypothetical protein
LLTGSNSPTAIGRLLSGFLCDFVGPLNTISMAMLVDTMTTLSIRPVSDTLARLVAFAITNGIAQRPFYAGSMALGAAGFSLTQPQPQLHAIPEALKIQSTQ